MNGSLRTTINQRDQNSKFKIFMISIGRGTVSGGPQKMFMLLQEME